MYTTYSYDYGNSMQSFLILTIIALVLAAVCTVLAFIFITPEKKRAALPKFFQIVHDIFNFKGLMIEAILKALYIFFTIFAILESFFTIFVNPLSGILSLILSPILIRLCFEFLMLAILLVKNVIAINNKLKNENDGKESDSPFRAPTSFVQTFAPAEQSPDAASQPASEPAVCPNCGTPIAPDAAFCTSCGTKLQK